MRDHPRIRGEHTKTFSPPRAASGSSPHTRGALRGVRRRGARTRIIPAYAGSTASHQCAPINKADHPRIRGEHTRRRQATWRPTGSSPHTRGARRTGQPPRRRSGIIPAYAGSTTAAVVWDMEDPDHPRIRGEHVVADTLLENLNGSSPHTRGARAGRPGAFDRLRIIPAYAGSTSTKSTATGR